MTEPTRAQRLLINRKVRITDSAWPDHIGFIGLSEWDSEGNGTAPDQHWVVRELNGTGGRYGSAVELVEDLVVVEPITPANVRALALSQAKQLYPDGDLHDHITAAAWLLQAPEPEIKPIAPPISSGPTAETVETPWRFRWTDSQGNRNLACRLDSPDSDGDIAWMSTHDEDKGTRTVYFNPAQAASVVEILRETLRGGS